MKKLRLLTVASFAIAAAGLARAADLPSKIPSSIDTAPLPDYIRNGCYIGGEGGGNWGRSNIFDLLTGTNLTGTFGLSGGVAGGTVGCNWQTRLNWVIGIEDDMSWTNTRGAAANAAVATTTNTLSERWIDTLRGRIGYAWGQVLFYGTAGAAFANTGLTVCGLGGCFAQSLDRAGWAAGAGVEVAFSANWSAKIEYIHAGFGSANYTASPSPPVDPRRISLADDIVRAGVNYRFNWGGPIAASY